MAALPKRRRFNVVEYYRMADAGILNENDRVELIKGDIIEMPPIGVGHASIVNRLMYLLMDSYRDSAFVSVQNPLRLSGRSEPVPDLLLLKRRQDFYRERHPLPEDVFLVVEVSDTTLRYDRDEKLPLYADAGVPELWIVDLQNDLVHTYLRPLGRDYRDHLVQGRGKELAPVALLEPRLAVSDILGPPVA